MKIKYIVTIGDVIKRDMHHWSLSVATTLRAMAKKTNTFFFL